MLSVSKKAHNANRVPENKRDFFFTYFVSKTKGIYTLYHFQTDNMEHIHYEMFYLVLFTNIHIFSILCSTERRLQMHLP
jgi:hypothetical protein